MNNFRRNISIAASSALSAVLGSIHAFSVFIPQWESLPGADRASVSLIYSIALVSLTVAVLFGYRLYQRIPPAVMFLLIGAVAASGLILSAGSASLVSLYLTYGLVFGGANGIGYGYILQLAGQAAPSRRGLAMGLVTAFYAVGATVAPLFFVLLIARGGNTLALMVAGAIVLLTSIVAATVVYLAKVRYISEPDSTNQLLTPTLKRARLLLWVGYGSAVTAGLMVIGHAYGIATWMNLDASYSTWATMIVAFGSMLGGFCASMYADRLSSQLLLRWLPLFTSLGLLLLLALPLGNSGVIVFLSLALVGYCYGAIIAVYPVAVADIFGTLAAPRIYGQVFTAWGLAGLFGPWISGWIFDQTGTYNMALLIAVLLSGLSIIAIRYCLPGSYEWTQRQ